MARESKPPLHHSIEADLRRKIASGEMGVGQMLPGRRDLAKHYGVSTLTVERAVDSLVRDRLLRSDDRRGTFVSAVSSQVPLKPRPTGEFAIGVVARLYMPHQDRGYGNNTWIREIVQAVEHEFSSEKHVTIFTNTVLPDGRVRPLREAVQAALESKIDGLLIVAIDSSPEEMLEVQELLALQDVQSVFVGSTELPRKAVQTFPDGFDAGYQAVGHLLRQGCEEIAYVSPFDAWWADQRGAGIAAAWEGSARPPERLRMLPLGEKRQWTVHPDAGRVGEETAEEVASIIGPRCGIIGANDEISLGLIRAMAEMGKAVGRDYLIIGFDDILPARDRHLTSLRPPWDALGREGARLLRSALAGTNESLLVRLRWRLIPRSSSRWTS
ncbi:GntR family transcriptional regulator [bacterium]|nr:MAG: GntR family transcriptional regulator [bacterium]